MDSIDLSGAWRLSDVDGDHSVPMALPGDGISALFDAGVLENPYWGRNEYTCRWVAERDWIVSREFELSETDVVLILDQVDTVAEIILNGLQVGRFDNAFRKFRIDLSNVARTGKNKLEIRFPSAVRIANERQSAQPFRVPYQASNSPVGNGNMLRKPQCDFGWDWNIALVPFGIYGAIRIEKAEAARIDRLEIEQSVVGNLARLIVSAHLSGHPSEAPTFTFNGETKQAAGDGSDLCTVEFLVEAPALWWPNGLGDQPLYELEVVLGPQVERRKIGFRTIEHVTEPDGIGAGFGFRVNGHPVFAKGANWIPADALPSRITPEKTRSLLQSAADANMNMIRVWGGGRYEPDWFYDICDELGLMVWQDFMFACNLYPSDQAFLEEVDSEIREVAARLHHRASLALWCGDNELVGALDWFEESRSDRDRYLAAYDRLNHTIERALKATDPNANWWPSSPSRGRLDFGDGWHDDTSGDMHFWSVWHEGRDFDHYRDVAPRFCSEFGFQSYPSMDQVRSFAAPEDFNIAAPVLESHQKNEGGNARIAETMFRYFRFPEGFENFVYISQVQQALAIKTAVTQWRSLKPRCMGTIYWQLNDTWPVCSWSSLDYGGGWKLLHHAARHFFEPVTVIAKPDGDSIRLVAANDGIAPVRLSLTVQALALDGSLRTLSGAEALASVDTSVDIEKIPLSDLGEQELLYFSWQAEDGSGGRDHFAPRPYKSYDLLPANVQLTQAGNDLILKSDAAAFFVALEADVPGRFSDNGMLVLPDDPVSLSFTPSDASASPKFTMRDLHSATYPTP